MCGRFNLRANSATLKEVFPLLEIPELTPRYNIAPTQSVAAVRLDDHGQRVDMLRWGLIPFWAEDKKIGYKLINARADSVASKPAFRSAFRKRRCLVLADGFYEWQKTDGKKQPYCIGRSDGRPFAFAGLWEHWDKGEPINSCTIITTDANDVVRPLHDRMPAILLPTDFDRWLDPTAGAEELQSLLRPLAAELTRAYPVSTHVNNVKNDDPRCLEPLQSGTNE